MTEVHRLRRAALHRYTAGMEHILQVVKEAFPNVRITLLEPSPYDDVTVEPQFPRWIQRRPGPLRAVCQGAWAEKPDVGGRPERPVVEMLKKANALDPAGAKASSPAAFIPRRAGTW